MQGPHTKRHDTERQRGAVLAVTAFILIALLGLAAFAIDIGHLYVVRNELQNAADAGALAGAANLYTDPDGPGPLLPGSKVNTDANQFAYNTATANLSDRVAVDVNWTSGNVGDVQRGHWSFQSGVFTPNASENATDLWLKTEEELDNDLDFINAVRVTARRSDTPALSFFAKIFGFDDFIVGATAVAYLGFSGSLGPGEADQPIVICKDSIIEVDASGNETYSCNVGRMINSSDDGITTNTAAWTDMTLDDGNCNGTNAASVSPKVCSDAGANSISINNGDALNSTNGMVDSVFADLESCWLAASDILPIGSPDGIPDRPYRMNLPVVICGPHATGNCPVVVGAVTIDLMLLTGTNSHKPEDVVPTSMTDTEWDSSFNWNAATDCASFSALVGMEQQAALPLLPDPAGDDRWDIANRWDGDNSAKDYEQAMANWDCFVDHYSMVNTNGKMAPLANKSMYFLPDCSPHPPVGNTGGSNFGVLAEIPALVD